MPAPIISNPRCPTGCAACACPSSTRPMPTSPATAGSSTTPRTCAIEIVRWPARGLASGRRGLGRRGRHDAGRVRQRMAGRHPVRPQRGRGRALRARVPRRAVAGATRRIARSGAHAAVALQLPSRRRPAVLSARSRGSSTFRSRCPATTSRRSTSSASASTARAGSTSTPTSGTKACSRVGHAALLRQPGRRACARVGGLPARVRLPARSGVLKRAHRRAARFRSRAEMPGGPACLRRVSRSQRVCGKLRRDLARAPAATPS